LPIPRRYPDAAGIFAPKDGITKLIENHKKEMFAEKVLKPARLFSMIKMNRGVDSGKERI